MENKFLMIPNKFFEINEDTGATAFHQIGTEGFTVWTYLIMTQGSGIVAQTSIKRIKTFLNRNKDTRAKKSKEGLSDTRTIKKYLIALLKVDAISDIEEEAIIKARADDELFIKVDNCIDKNEGFSKISTQLFYDYIHKWGHIGWSIYCLLFKLHNKEFGSCSSIGFANPSEEYMENILDRHRTTISEYVHKFESGTVKVEVQECRTYYNAKKDREERKQESNHYTVWAKGDSNNKYFVG